MIRKNQNHRNWFLFYCQFLLFILFTCCLSKASLASKGDTIIVSFSPANCKNCLVDIESLDSMLKANGYIIKYYLFGLRKTEISYYLQNKMKFILPGQVHSNSVFLDSIFSKHLTNFFLPHENKIIELNDFKNDIALYCKIQVNESLFPLNSNGVFKYFNHYLVYFEGDVLNKMAVYNMSNGKFIKEIRWNNDSITELCYNLIYKTNAEKALRNRNNLIEQNGFNLNEEITIKNVEIYKSRIYLFCTLNMIQFNQNRIRPYDLMFTIDKNFNIVDYFVSEFYLYKDQYATVPFTNVNYLIRNDSDVIKPIYTIFPDQNNKFNVLGVFRFKDHRIYLDSVLKINSSFLTKKAPSGFFLMVFSNQFYFNSNLFFNCNTFPYIYNYLTGAEIKLLSKPEIDDVDDYDEALKSWPFYVLKIEDYKNRLYVYTRENNIITLSVFDSEFNLIKKTDLTLMDIKLTKKDLIQIIRTHDGKIEYFVYTDDESFYKEQLLPND